MADSALAAEFRAVVREELAARRESESAPAYLEERTAASRYGIEARAIAAARKAGELPGFRVGRRVLVAVADLDAWIASKRINLPTDTDDPLDRMIASGAMRRGAH